jgi:hypothetical protein
MAAKTAGFIANARNWRFSDDTIKTADGSKVRFSNTPNPRAGDVPYGDRY